MSAKIWDEQQSGRKRDKDLAKYFVPASTISDFISTAQATLLVTPLTAMAVSGPQGGPFSPSLFEYRISASTGTVGYSIRTPSWLTASSSVTTRSRATRR